jgi:MoxR-like ATPase
MQVDNTASGRSEPVDDVKLVSEFQDRYQVLRKEIHKVVIGQEKVIDELLICLFSRGHALLVGVPGLAKTLLVKTLAGVLGWDFKRIQFTPDMMPSDITGTDILQTDPKTGERRMQFIKGPIFSNLVLSDEINRAPPKTQAALLEAMQEYTVTASGHTYELDQPFMVAATQNPIEHEGTYPLPEAQLDRFMFNIEVGYPDRDNEIRIVAATTSKNTAVVESIMTKEDILVYQGLVRRMPVSDHVLSYAVDIAKASRPSEDGMGYVNEYVEWGAGLRASQYMILGAKSLALLRGLPTPSCKEVRDVAVPVLQHRIIRNYKAAGKGIDTKMIIANLLKLVKESDYSGKKVRTVSPGITLDLRGLKKKSPSQQRSR